MVRRSGCGIAPVNEELFFLACVFYGAAIWLIAQIFHIQSHYPDAFWYWALGALPFVLCLDTLLMHALYAVLLAIWVGAEILGFSGLGFHGWFFIRHCAFTLPLLALPGLLWGYHKRSAVTIGIYAPLLAWWAILLPVAWDWNVDPIYFVGLAGALLLLIAESHRVGSPLAVPYRLYGVLITGGVLVALSCADEIIGLLGRNLDQNYAAGLVVGIIGAVGVLGAVLLQQRDTQDKARAAVPFATLVRRHWLPLGLMLLMVGLCFWCEAFGSHDSRHPYYTYNAYNPAKWTPQVLVPTVVFNAAMIVLAIWLMRRGLREQRTLPFTGGVLYFLLWAVLRYEDLFAGVGGMLGAAVMFLLCGVGLLVVARFWMHRKEVSPATALTLTLSQRERGPEVLSETESRPEALPLAMERLVAWLKGRQRTLVGTGLGFQLVVLATMIVVKVWPLLTGEIVLLRVVPVDPRDMFRGDYVALSYDFSQAPKDKMSGFDVQDPDTGTTAYVSLVPEEDGKHWRMSGVSAQKPAAGKYIRGTFTGWRRIECGIESYYVQEGHGQEYEDAARSHKLSAESYYVQEGEGGKYEDVVRDRRLSAEVALTADGRAALRGLQIEEPLPSAGPAYERASHYRWPSDKTYRLRHLAHANVSIDGRLDEPEWSRANVERDFTFPWKEGDAPATEFLALCDDKYLYFAFRVEDADVVALDTLRDKEDLAFEDRVEMYFSPDNQMKDYYCIEIDSRGRVNDYRAAYYRQFDGKWKCEGLETAGLPSEKGYTIEGRIPLATLYEMGFPHLARRARSGDTELSQPATVKALCGLYRAELSHDRSGKPVEQKETIHNRGRKIDGPPPVEEWISWVDPRTPEPDFHVPSSLGWLEIVE